MKSKYLFNLIVAAAVIIFSGCMTTVTVITEPAGAVIYNRGVGRASYKYKYVGSTRDGQVVTFKVPYSSISTFALWPAANGAPEYRSEAVYTKLLFEDDPVIVIKKK